MNNFSFIKKTIIASMMVCLLITLILPSRSDAQYKTKWMSVGTFHNWYSEMGAEIEHGLLAVQQCGAQWPALYAYQDMQAAKGFWMGCVNFTDERGDFYPHKVVHVGPRARGIGEIIPTRFEMISRFSPPEVYVDGEHSFEKEVENDIVDPTIQADRIIINEANTLLGLTMKRKLIQFGQQFNDNYIIHEHTFINSGNIDEDDEIELPDQTLEGVYFFYQYRWAISYQTRYLIGNGTGWGMNTMIDTRGDGVKEDPADEQFRCQFAWHGNFPPFTDYDNIGAPIFAPIGYSSNYIGAADTVGRLGSAQFLGVVTIHADKSADDNSDDISQPSTTTYESSDADETSNNDAFNPAMMAREYGWMSKGHMKPRHADKVEPDGDFTTATGDPALGTPGGFSACNGYGPYDLAFGDSVKIVFAEGASGLNRDMCIKIGNQFKRGIITKEKKNEWVLTGRDSLFQTFRRAIDNYKSGYNIQQPPRPPKAFYVNSGGDRILLEWDVYEEADPEIKSFEIYRARGAYDSTYQLIHEAQPDERSHEDMELTRGVSYYYYICSVGDEISPNSELGIKSQKLRSSRFYTQTYDPAFLKRPAGERLSDIRVVPNPYNISADQNKLLFPDEPNKLAFFNIPGRCTIKIYTEIGELIKTIEHTDDTGDAYWDCTTDYKQIVVSGVYIAVITDTRTGDSEVVKFVIIR